VIHHKDTEATERDVKSERCFGRRSGVGKVLSPSYW
jgi:hypothetical protein